MSNPHLEQAAALLAEAEEEEKFNSKAPAEEACILREKALIHAVLAVAEEIAAHRKVLARRR